MAKILIVDDEKSIRVTLAEFLREAGHEAFAEADATAAAARLCLVAFDVVVSDIILPGISGVELLLTIRAQAPDAQVIMMTGEPTVETAVAAVRAGAHDYLTKPIGKPLFLRSVERAVRVKTLLDEKHALEAATRDYQASLEQMVNERTRSLRESETRLRKLARAVDQSPVSIVITDRAGGIEFVNPKFTQVTGYTPEEALGRNPGHSAETFVPIKSNAACRLSGFRHALKPSGRLAPTGRPRRCRRLGLATPHVQQRAWWFHGGRPRICRQPRTRARMTPAPWVECDRESAHRNGRQRRVRQRTYTWGG